VEILIKNYETLLKCMTPTSR